MTFIDKVDKMIEYTQLKDIYYKLLSLLGGGETTTLVQQNATTHIL